GPLPADERFVTPRWTGPGFRPYYLSNCSKLPPSGGRMHIAVTGSQGLIGTALVEALTGAGHRVTRLVRRPPGAGEVRWDPARGEIDAAALEGTDAVVHLAGVGIGDHRWTDEHKRAVIDSRVQGTTLLSRTIALLSPRP